MLLCETFVCMCVCEAVSPFCPHLLLCFLTSLWSYISCASVFAFALHLWGSVFCHVCDPVLFHEITTVDHDVPSPHPLFLTAHCLPVWRRTWEDFPGGLVVGSLPASERDTGSTSGTGRPHMLWSNKAQEPTTTEPVFKSLSATRTEPTTEPHLELVLHNKRSHHKEKPAHWTK